MDLNNLEEGHEDSQDVMHFHYNRAERISRAPQNVQDYYSGKMKVNAPGLFKSLVSTKSNRFIFMALVVFVAVVFIQGFFGNKPYRKNVEGIPMELKASDISGEVIVSLVLGENIKKYDYSEGINVSAVIEYLDEQNNVVLSDNFTTEDSVEIPYSGEKITLRTKTEGYDIIKRVRVIVALKEKKVDLTAVVEQR